MRTKLTAIWIMFALVAAFANAIPIFALEVKLTVQDYSQTERSGDVVTSGIPFAKGALKDSSKLVVKNNGKAIPAQFVTIVPWEDGSARWVLLDTQLDVPSGKSVELTLSDKGRNPAPKNPVKVDDGKDKVTVSTGPLEFTVSKTKFNIFESLKIDGKELITSVGKGLVIYKVGGGEILAGAPSVVKLENAGPLRATLCLKGKFPGVHGDLLGYTVRLTAYSGQKFLKMHVWFENDGGLTVRSPKDAQWFGFDGFSAEFGLNLGDKISASCEDASAEGKFKVEQRCPTHDWKGFAFNIVSGDKELKKGARTDGVVTLSGANGKLTTAVRHFWENYEKAVELDGSTLKIWLWPTDGEWPRRVNRGHDANEYPQFRKPGTYFLSGGTRKGHEFILDFSGRDAKFSAATLNAPLRAQTTPEYVASTEAAPGWFAPANFTSGKEPYDASLKIWNALAQNAIAPAGTPGSLYTARRGGADERGSWHGWMDFGDNLWAEGYSSLHYDWTWIMLTNYLRSGENNFLDVGTTMARHRIDIDQIWTSRDSQYYSNLTRYEATYTSVHAGLNDGYYGPITSHVWLSGVVLYYMLTGEEQARECAVNCGEGLRRRQVSRYQKPNAGGQTRESGWAILGFCSLYDLTADKKYLDDAMLLFNNHIAQQWKKRGPYLEEALQYYYTTQGLCELHQRTGNPEVMKLIKEGCDGKFPQNTYAEWRVFLSNIYAYTAYVSKDESYLKKAEELFSIYTNSQKNLKCYVNTGAWDKESGKLLRNGHILEFVEWKLGAKNTKNKKDK